MHVHAHSTPATVATITLASLCALLQAVLAPPAHAGEIYAGAGLPGVFAGYAHGLSDQFALRADFATLGSHRKDGEEEGIDYRGKLESARLGLFGDYFPWRGGFRLTGGLTLNRTQIELNSNFTTTSTQTVGDQTVIVGPSDYFNVRLKYPTVMPFLGIGYGHAPSRGVGWGFHADLGASWGRAKVSVDTNLTAKGLTQANIDKETQSLRDGVAKFSFIPQISLGVSYRF